MVDEKKKVKVFAGPAYLKILEKGLYGLFRDVETDVDGKREKVGKPIGPLSLLREARSGEEKKVVLRSVHPVDGRPLDLVESSG